jgi:hypothetical protein
VEAQVTLDVVYPYKLSDTQELRYSLRGLSNIQHGNVFVVGDLPDWLTNEAYAAVVPQTQDKYTNLCNNLRIACLLPGVSDPFIVMNDDFFIMRRTEKIHDLYRDDIHSDIERVARHGMWGWLDGFERVRNAGGERSYELHVPMIVYKEPMLEALEKFGPTPVWRTAYGLTAGIHGMPYRDVKVKRMDQVAEGRFVSTTNRTFAKGQVGKDIRSAFPSPSIYEHS